MLMTDLFNTLYRDYPMIAKLLVQRPRGTTVDNTLYADDTICFGTRATALAMLLQAIERAAIKYGTRLNEGKCAVLALNCLARTCYKDGTKVPNVAAIEYLGAYLTEDLNHQHELNHRLQHAMATWKKLEIFWKHSDGSKRIKLLVYNVVIRSKLLYSLESLQLTQALVNKLNTFQFKGLREILKMSTTSFTRANTNKRVYEIRSPSPQLLPFSQLYRAMKIKLLGHILRLPVQAVERNVAFFHEYLKVNLHAQHRVGQPRLHWTLITLTEAWKTKYKEGRPESILTEKFNAHSTEHMEILQHAALARWF